MSMDTVENIIERLKAFSTPEICDGVGLFHAMYHDVKPLFECDTVVGKAVTVEVPTGEAKIIADVIKQLMPGDVLVIAAKGNLESACWGDLRSRMALKHGAVGVIIDGAARDIKGLRRAGLPIFARALCCGSAQLTGAGAANIPVSCAGAVVCPGDIIMADENGVIAVKPQEAEIAMEKATKKKLAEVEKLKNA